MSRTVLMCLLAALGASWLVIPAGDLAAQPVPPAKVQRVAVPTSGPDVAGLSPQ